MNEVPSVTGAITTTEVPLSVTRLTEYDAYGYDEPEDKVTMPGVRTERQRINRCIAAADMVTACKIAEKIFLNDVESVTKRNGSIYIKS